MVLEYRHWGSIEIDLYRLLSNIILFYFHIPIEFTLCKFFYQIFELQGGQTKQSEKSPKNAWTIQPKYSEFHLETTWEG